MLNLSISVIVASSLVTLLLFVSVITQRYFVPETDLLLVVIV